MSPAIAEVLETFAPLAIEKSVELTSVLEDELQVHADRERICQVVVNLVSNALKFTRQTAAPRSARAATAATWSSTSSTPASASPPTSCPQLFGRFYRTSGATEGAVPGTGLGLAICRAIVEAHGGSPDVAETSERGTTFRLRLASAT